MMMWYDSNINGWGYALMIVGMVIFWVLIAACIVVLFRYTGNGAAPSSAPRPRHRSAQQILAERFAHGDIDEDEYRRRLNTLDDTTPR
jgi:putative membrane protein